MSIPIKYLLGVGQIKLSTPNSLSVALIMGSNPLYLVIVKRFVPMTYKRTSCSFIRFVHRDGSVYPTVKFSNLRYDPSSTK